MMVCEVAMPGCDNSTPTWLHRLDPRAKLIAAACFVLSGAMIPSEEWPLLLALCAAPIAALAMARVPGRFVARRCLGVGPLVILLAVGNPRASHAAGFQIILTATLALLIGMALLATTSMPAIATGLRRLRAPSPLVTQITLIYRYLFMIRECAADAIAARSLRDGGRGGFAHGLRAWGNIFGVLFARSLGKADRVASAMDLRGFTGQFPTPSHSPMRPADWAFVTASALLPIGCIMLRLS
jgi:energy-coupling factor transporter transmembrane protein EcfT